IFLLTQFFLLMYTHIIQKYLIAFIFSCGCVISMPLMVVAQLPETNSAEEKVLPDQFDSNDSLNVSDNESIDADSLTQEKISFADVDVPIFEDQVYNSRLKEINSQIPLDYNEQVRKYIDLYVLHRRSQVQRMVGLSKFYYPIFDQIFEAYGVPPEMKNLAIIESALNPHAVSKAGAVGMWQFMYGTAKMYKLSVNDYFDERRDIIRSTEGAAQYLKGMYDVYGDWLLAIASYNCGPQNVNRAIAKSGGNTFWAIQNYLPKETRTYVPAFIAATYVMSYYDEHQIEPTYPQYSWDSIVSICVNDKMSCDQIAKFTNLTLEELKFLNPGLRSSVIPALDNPYCLKLPGDRADMFTLNHDSIIEYSTNSKTQFYYGATGGNKTYTVRSGDNLGKIAAKYRVSVTQIKKWNRLNSNTIHPGQKLKIYSSGGDDASAIASTKKSSSPTKSTASVKSKTELTDQYVYYKARNGDTLWEIAKKHGTTVEQIRVLNGASKCNNLQVGTVLKIGSKG
ncbi:MAG: LysM peptidoglycan-binding domain-containing protein, partial [Chitinophagales bacterium]|nr:LysM peptidoglycan-binding domain-containing protein [Chitinophagales bacterium]